MSEYYEVLEENVFVKYFYLKDKVMEKGDKETEEIIQLLDRSLDSFKFKAYQIEINVGSFFEVCHIFLRVPSTWAIFYNFPRPLAGSWIPSEAARTQA